MDSTTLLALIIYGGVAIACLFIYPPASIFFAILFLINFFRAKKEIKQKASVKTGSSTSNYSSQKTNNNQSKTLVCSACGKTHGMLLSVRNAWHKCPNCGKVYCDECGKDMPKDLFMPVGVRKCSCGTRMNLVLQ